MIKIINRFSSISAFLIAYYCAFANNNSMYNFIFLIPLVYSFTYFFFSVSIEKRSVYGLNLVFIMSQVLIYVRYVLTPFFTIFSARFTSWGWGPDPSNSQMITATLLMCVEEILIFIVQYFAIRKFSQKKYIAKMDSSSAYDESYFIIILFAIISYWVVFSIKPSLILGDLYKGEETIEEIHYLGMYVILADVFKKVFLIIALIIFKKRYDKTGYKLYLLLAVAAVAVNMILNAGETRMRMVISLILGAYFLHYIFGDIPKIFYAAGIVLCGVAFISISTKKFSYAIGNTDTPVSSVLSVMLGQFQDYFAGPRLVGQMLNVSQVYKDSIGLSTFINDFTGSIPMISKYVDQTNRINYYFNIYCNMPNQTLIAPILGIGYCYFPFFPFAFTLLFEYLCIKLDYLMTATNKITKKYMYAYMGFLCAMCMGYSTQNIYGQFISGFVPLFLLFTLNDKVKLKKASERLTSRSTPSF